GAVYGYCDAHIPCDTTKTPYLACDPVTSTCINCRQTRQHRIINGFCMKDGAIGGFCSQEISCTKSGSSCDAEFNTCISCTMAGYRSVNGYCLQDGVFGGYCDTVVNCTDGTGCGPESHVCVNCSSNGYRVLPDGFCRQDGLIGGYCDANISCLTFSGACDPATSLCSTCYAGHSIINGYCYKGKLNLL
ncbi:prion-like-(Q/N-rich) domain-bearing protein 25, partial [Ruditapes philippinarum]|uniref:prion-like-(Q/N-rich) domain-bearing protein 25 n=1 Tax=Ruditapes philippinarum TaxID=129788 RepID=UPI00295BA8F4